jgi:hypothetical protein
MGKLFGIRKGAGSVLRELEINRRLENCATEVL